MTLEHHTLTRRGKNLEQNPDDSLGSNEIKVNAMGKIYDKAVGFSIYVVVVVVVVASVAQDFFRRVANITDIKKRCCEHKFCSPVQGISDHEESHASNNIIMKRIKRWPL